LQSVTHLELGTDEFSYSFIQQLQQLSSLRQLVLTESKRDYIVPSGLLLAGMPHARSLTMLVVSNNNTWAPRSYHRNSRPHPTSNHKPAVLADISQLQHLTISGYQPAPDGPAVPELFQSLQQLTQLTYLELGLCTSGFERWRTNVPAADCAALTSSSQLQHLVISGGSLSPGAWQQMFSPGKHLPHMQQLDCVSGSGFDIQLRRLEWVGVACMSFCHRCNMNE
jgi:hypothetical protein